MTEAEIAAIANAGIAGKLKQNATIDSNTLILLYQAENNANDARGANDGTLQNRTIFAGGRVGQAVSFDGVDDFVQIANASSLDFGADDFSVELWLNLNRVSGEQTLIMKRVGTFPNSRKYAIETGTDGGLRFLVRDTTSNENDLVIPNLISANAWYHFAAVRQGTTAKYISTACWSAVKQPEQTSTREQAAQQFWEGFWT